MSDGTRAPRQARNDSTKATVTVLTTWPRDGWIASLWDSAQLTPSERLVGLAYARYAFESDVAWVAWSRLAQMTGIRSKVTLSKATKGLIDAGWLVQVDKARQHRSPRYRLVVPEGDVRHTYAESAEVAAVVEMPKRRQRAAK